MKAPDVDTYEKIVELINNNAVRGPAGETPVRGVDYWNEEDIAVIKAHVEQAILEGEW